jgi:hypothetical protein
VNPTSRLSRWLREPLVHFIFLGAALFGLSALLKTPASRPSAYRIVVTPGIMENLKIGFQRSSRRPPTAQEVDKLIDGYVREEVLIREANAMGLPHDDPTVRTWLIQRMEFLNEDAAGISAPTDAELNVYLTTLGDSFRKPDGSLPAMSEVRDQLTDLWKEERRREAGKRAYEDLRRQYSVEIERAARQAP